MNLTQNDKITHCKIVSQYRPLINYIWNCKFKALSINQDFLKIESLKGKNFA